METRTNFSVKVLIAIVFIVALVSVIFWSMSYMLTSQSLQNQVNTLVTEKENLQFQVTNMQSQVTNLQNQVNSLTTQLAEKEKEIEYAEILETVYLKDISNILKWIYPSTESASRHSLLTR